MSAITTFSFYPDGAKRQIEIVCYDKQIFQWDIFFLQPVQHGFSAQVHISTWLKQEQTSAFDFVCGDVAQFGRFKIQVFIMSQSVENFKTDIVTGVFIFGANVSKSGDEKFLHGVFFFKYVWFLVCQYASKKCKHWFFL